MDAQDSWFRKTLVPAFEKEYNCKITVVTFDKFPDIEAMADLEVKSGHHTIGLIKTSVEEVYPMVAKGYMMPLEEVAGKEQLSKDPAEYVELAVNAGVVDGIHYYIPRKLETNVFFYLKSKVADAVANWESLKADIDSMFKKQNGYGLPAEYNLESDPNEWDWYDLAVVSYYWANTPGDDGLVMPRMAHRGKDYGGITNELYTKIYQMGGTEKDVLAMDTPSVIDMFEWEAFYVRNGLYNPGMWEESWSGGGIWKAFAAGRVYAVFMHQIDAFFLHGGTHPSMAGYLTDPDDMGTAIMPEGVSLELDRYGKPLRTGGYYSNFSGWWWGIPKTSPYPELSYKLAHFITSYEWHTKEYTIFGMMPVRKDIFDNIAGAFPEKWKQEVFKTALAQFKAGVIRAPMVPTAAAIGQNYRKAWYDMCTGKNYAPDPGIPPDRDYIIKALQPYIKTNKELAGIK